jgi:hypothetical protein
MKMRRWPLTISRARPASSPQFNQWDPIPVRWARDVSRVPQPGVFQRVRLDHLQAILIAPDTQNRYFTKTEHLPAGIRLQESGVLGGLGGIPEEPPNVVPRSRDPKRPLRSLKSHAKPKSLYSGLSSGFPTSPTQRVCTESPGPHPSRVFIGQGQEAGLLILGVNRLDVIQVRGSWHIGIGFYSIVSWSSVVWPELFLFLVTLGKGLLCSVMIGSGLRWCIPEEGSCPGYGAFQGRGCAQVSDKEQRSLSLK